MLLFEIKMLIKKKIRCHFRLRYIGSSCPIFILSLRDWFYGQVLPWERESSLRVCLWAFRAANALERQQAVEWKDWKSVSDSIADFLCCSIGKHLGPGFQKSSIRHLTNWFCKSDGLYNIQLLMLHSLSSWLLQNSAACPINTDFVYQLNIFLIFFNKCYLFFTS